MKRLRIVFVPLLIFIALSAVVFAASVKYFEFNPDYFLTKAFNVSGAGAIYEIFIPANEFLGGFDFWVDNDGSAGLVSFEVWDKNGNVVASKNITAPHIDPISGGEKIHIELNSQIPVIANEQYKIRISSALPELRLYYADRLRVLGHNEPYISNYINGAAEIGGEEKEFSFKYALYESTETSPPIISNISWTSLSPEQMKIEFNSNEPVDYKIAYGVNQSYGQGTNFTGDYKFCAEGAEECAIIIPVEENISYQYVLTVKDSWGNQSQSTGTFASGQSQQPTSTPIPTATTTPTPSLSASPPPGNGDAPIISNFRITEITNNSVEVAWTTDKPADSNLRVVFAGFISIAASFDSTLELEHLLKAEGQLGPGTTYKAIVISTDQANNSSTASLSFTTLLAPPPSSSPVPSQTPQSTPLQSQSVNTPAPGDNYVQWQAPAKGEPSGGYRVDIFDENGNFVKTINVPAGTHATSVEGLKEGDYSVIVYANDDGVFRKVNQPSKLKFKDDTFLERLLALWPYLLAGVLLLAGFLIWQYLKKKPSQIIKPPVS